MKCPICGLFNPEEAQRCDCGYDFPSGKIKASYLSGAGAVTEIPGCQSCGSLNVEQGYAYQLCQACRNTLALRPLPGWSRLFFGSIAALLALSLVGFPDALVAGIAFERGRRAEARGDWNEAAARYSIVAGRFPDSALAQAKAGLAYFRQKDYQKAAATFELISGRKIDSELASQVNTAIEFMEKLRRVQGPQ